MREKVENTYGKTVRAVFKMANPIKKRVINTPCIVHKFINGEAVKILKNTEFQDEYNFFLENLYIINKGVMWADSDFKSANHFYHFEEKRGLYGFSNALDEFNKYYKLALKYIEIDELDEGLFYFGAACHLVQDAVVPAHANIGLRSHRKFENFAVKKVLNGYRISSSKPLIFYQDPSQYVIDNADYGAQIEKRYRNIEDVTERYDAISNKCLARASESTAALLVLYYKYITQLPNKYDWNKRKNKVKYRNSSLIRIMEVFLCLSVWKRKFSMEMC